MACAASITAFRPEPQTLLMARLDDGLARRVLAGGGLQHLAEDHFTDLVAGELGPLEQFDDHGRAELGRGCLGQGACELADGSAGGGDDDDVGGHGDLQKMDGFGLAGSHRRERGQREVCQRRPGMNRVRPFA
jgi:hypothetical protein